MLQELYKRIRGKHTFSLEDKIDKLLSMSIYLSGNSLLSKERRFISSYIAEDIKLIEDISKIDMYTTRVTTKAVDDISTCEITYMLWLSDNGYINLHIENDIKRYLAIAKELYYKYSAIKDNKSNICMYNSRKIQPYIINIETIVKDIYLAIAI